MNQSELINEAKKMFLENKSRRDVITYFKLKGIEEEESEKMATEAYKSIRELRQALINAAEAKGGESNTFGTATQETDKTGAIISLVLGLLICGGGIIASMGTNRIFYGAVIVGGAMAIKGIYGLVS